MLPPLPKPDPNGYTPEQVYEYGRWVAARCVSTCAEIKQQIEDDGGKLNYAEAINHVAGAIQRRFVADMKTFDRG